MSGLLDHRSVGQTLEPWDQVALSRSLVGQTHVRGVPLPLHPCRALRYHSFDGLVCRVG